MMAVECEVCWILFKQFLGLPMAYLYNQGQMPHFHTTNVVQCMPNRRSGFIGDEHTCQFLAISWRLEGCRALL